MHFQFPPAAEAKLVRCTRGAILDIIVDLRPESPTYLEHVAVELNAENMRSLYVPERFAHGRPRSPSCFMISYSRIMWSRQVFQVSCETRRLGDKWVPLRGYCR